MPLAGPARPAVRRAASVIPAFRRWIRKRRPEGRAIDISRNGHESDGSGAVLVGSGDDLALVEIEGVPALRYTLKRAEHGDPAQHVVLALGRLLEAVGDLERDTDIRIDRSSVTVRIADRRNAPNTDAVRQALQGEVVSAVISTLGIGTPDIIGGSTDPRDALSWTLRGGATPMAA